MEKEREREREGGSKKKKVVADHSKILYIVATL